MRRVRSLIVILIAAMLLLAVSDALAAVPENLQPENTVAWCIVPFDVKKRSPEERAEMVRRMGMHRVAYDWRAEHVASFEDEMIAYQKHGIEYFAFWDMHPAIMPLIRKYQIHPQFWLMVPDPSPKADPATRVAAAAKALEERVRQAAALGCKVGLYNHGGWGGEPDTTVAVVKWLQAHGMLNVGIVYNLHHGHERIADFAAVLSQIQPYLLCLNLNGMNDGARPKILPLGQGQHDEMLMRIIAASGYPGPIGILCHDPAVDAELRLQDNLDGLRWLNGRISGDAAVPRPVPRSYQAAPVAAVPPKAKAPVQSLAPVLVDSMPGFGKGLKGGVATAPASAFAVAPVTVECRARLDSRSGFNILVASEPKSSVTHWELYTYAKSGNLAAYLPGRGGEYRSAVNVCDGKWHHLAMVHRGDAIELFVDGSAVLAGGLPAGPVPVGPVAVAAGRLVEGNIGCDGVIDNVRIRRGAQSIQLTPGPMVKDADTVVLWDFETAADLLSGGGVRADMKSRPTNEIDYRRHPINERRLFDFYTTQAEQYRGIPFARNAAEPLPEFPGLEYGKYGHWGVKNDNDWRDDRINQMQFGSTMAGVFRNGAITLGGGVSVQLGAAGELAICYDPAEQRIADAWAGGFIHFGNTRYGLMGGTPREGTSYFSTVPDGTWATASRRYLGYYRSGAQTVFAAEVDGRPVYELPGAVATPAGVALSRTFAFPDGTPTAALRLLDGKSGTPQLRPAGSLQAAVIGAGPGTLLFATPTASGTLSIEADALVWRGKASLGRIFLWTGDGGQIDAVLAALAAAAAVDPMALVKGGPRQWQALKTVGLLSDDTGPYRIDTLTAPHDNPYGSLLFFGGHDFFSNGDIAVCTMFGDVWRVSGIDESLRELTWTRMATGLNQPLGLLIVDDQVLVTCRDQITRLHDLNGDGEADFYEAFCRGYNAMLGGHDFATGLERDGQGLLYFVNPDGVHQISADGREHRIVATGLRNPDGLGVSPDGTILTAPQEGTWTPASMIIKVGENGYYGFGGPLKDRGYDQPLCYVPRGIDNSCGGQVYINSEKWGPFTGQWLGLSFGSSSAYRILPDANSRLPQAAIIEMPGHFLSGAHRGRFRPQDGQLYVSSSQGWVTSAITDGSLQRMRYTGIALCEPVGWHVFDNGIRVDFSMPLQKESAERINSYFVQQWTYLYSAGYGSPEMSIRHPGQTGHDRLEVRSAHLLADGRSVFIEIPQLQAAWQLHLNMALKAADGADFVRDMFATVHSQDLPFTEFAGYAAIPKQAPAVVAVTPPQPAAPPVAAAPVKRGREIRINAVSGLKYDVTTCRAKVGERLTIVVRNQDTLMPHNLVLVQSGQAQAVGEAAMQMISSPDAIARHYVPKLDAVLASTPLVDPGKTAEVSFDAPTTPGTYPYLCTFPGHWAIMRGELIVE